MLDWLLGFPGEVWGSDVLRFEQPIPQITSVQLRTPIEEVFITNKGVGKRVYLEKLEHLHELSKILDWLSCSNYVELTNSDWVSSLEVLPYTSESMINTQVCVRSFITVEVI